ncbi:M20/M25/M40 family metallo-hydrolase [Roseomonas marmotae]|uniref:M20/M25/M40 family metallo-hydrolase n=1 Tax=Roseomonas marmotae TaxID=2768161 RepID=A0ABS3K7J3_9PROT|nr:M20/M25/M40 family metallo-hydrolase [Roseomonas marmotae]MBO1073436.1 M20/M25/M40 family metallo-hydrolase [Roseomonas marmotae]QTI80368.1 M20/M25/M40 family metallo-hydrolase [Roseomonas marmotae]
MSHTDPVARLAADLIRIDSRSFVSNTLLAERIAAELEGFELERLDFTDARGVAKCVLVAHRGPPGGVALSGHMDTVPDTGWADDPFSGRIDADGVLHGLGAADMKGPLAACIVAARTLPAHLPATLLITTDEETTKQGARLIADRSALARKAAPRGIIVAEPTGMVPVRGHRSNIDFIAVSEGVQAHSSLGIGRNANWALIPFLVEMREIQQRLRDDASLHDDAYSPPFSDFNLIIDNHGAAVNVTVPVATARIKFRYSKRIDPTPVVEAVQAAAERAGIRLSMVRQGLPPETPADHPFIRAVEAATGHAAETRPFGTDASELQDIAPCAILGPEVMDTAHSPRERAHIALLGAAVPVFHRIMAG